MNKKLIMCEGPNEKKIIELLLRENKLIFSSDDLVGLVPYHARQLSAPILIPELSMYKGDFEIIRVGDTMKDELKIPKHLKSRIVRVDRYCTKPELEILLIINENLYSQFLKSKLSPKQFAKKCIVYNRQKYDNSTNFYDEYYRDRVDKLVLNLIEYRRIKKHNDGELFLADLLK